MIDNYKKDYESARLLFENYLQKYLDELTDIPEPVLSGIRYAMSAGGKRLRPVLALLTADMFGVDGSRVLPIALSIELIHNYSLVHDDLPCMDDDELRRGQPTVHVKFGEGMAVLIGDALLNMSMEVLASSSFNFGQSFGSVLRILYENSGAKGMIGGQCVDLASENSKEYVGEECVRYLHLHKTACLLKAPITSVAVVAGASVEDLTLLENYADNLGLAFQITDDVLDIEGDESVFGKPIGSDEEKGKLTYPAVFGLQESKVLAQKHVALAIESISRFNNNSNHVLLAKSLLNRMK